MVKRFYSNLFYTFTHYKCKMFAISVVLYHTHRKIGCGKVSTVNDTKVQGHSSIRSFALT